MGKNLLVLVVLIHFVVLLHDFFKQDASIADLRAAILKKFDLSPEDDLRLLYTSKLKSDFIEIRKQKPRVAEQYLG